MITSLANVEFLWHSTPRLWSAVRPGYDGAEDAGCKLGFGKTQIEALVDLVEQEDADPVLCSSCFDQLGGGYILTILPQTTCTACGKKCLGYETKETA